MTHRSSMPNTLRAADQAFRFLFENTPIPMWMYDRDSRAFLDVNTAAVTTYGYSKDEFLAMTVDEIFPDETAGTRHRTKNGIIIDVEITSYPIEMNGRAAELIMAQDITQRQQAEHAQRESEARLRAIIDAEPECIKVISLDGKLLEMNPSGLAMLEAESLADVQNKSLLDFVVPEYRKGFADHIHGALEEKSTQPFQFEVVGLKGGRSWLETNAVPLKDSHNRVTALLGITRNITERKRAEETVRESSELQQLLMRMATSFVNIPIEKIDQAINEALATIGAFVHADRAYLFRHDFAKGTMSNTHEWCGEGISKEIINSQNVPNSDMPDVVHAHLRGEVFVLPRVADLPENDSLRAILDPQRIKSLILFPMMYDRELIGFVGFDAVRETRVYTETETALLKVLAEILANAEVRRRSDESLRKSEENFRALVETTSDFIWEVNADCAYTYVSPQIENMLGYSPEELLGKTPFDLMPPEEALRVRESFQRIISERSSFAGLSNLNVHKNGHVLVFETSGVPVFDQAGCLRGYRGIDRDITQRASAEEALRENEEKFRTVVQNAQAVVFILDSAGVFRLSEGQALANLGLQPGQVVGLSAFDAYKDYPEVVNSITRALNGELTRVTAEVQGLIFDTLYSPYFDRSGKLAGVVGIATDITERIRSEEMLRQSEERYRRFFEEDLTGVVISNPDGTIVDCNPAFVRIFGFASREEALRTNAARLYENAGQRREFLEMLRQKRQLLNLELTLRRMDGTNVHTLENVVGSFDEQGNLVQLMGFISDKTVQKQLEQHLLQSQKMESLGTLASGIAHDFNNILGIVLGHAMLLGDSRTAPEKAGHHTDVILKATERGVGVVKQLLTFARKTEVLLESVRLTDIIHELTTLLSETFPKTITIDTSLAVDAPAIIADTNQMHQVLLNLFVNARDAMPGGGRLTVTTRAASLEEIRTRWAEATASEYVLLSVADTGVGMDDATRARIFEPFFTTKERGKGTGLGLATVYGIVQTHKGFVDVESQPGQGTVFMLCFPVQPRTLDMSPTTDVHAGHQPHGNETILFVEDEPMLQEMVNELLTSKGYTVLSASDGVRGAELYAQHMSEIALVISDLGLPRMGGDELFRAVKVLNPAVKFILASGFIDPIVRAMLTEQGLQHLLHKPYHPLLVLGKIREVLDAPH